MFKNKYINLILWVSLMLAVSSSMGVLTKNNINDWYINLNRSSLTPPNHFFGIVWTILYIMIAIAGWQIWQQKPSSKLSNIKRLYISQLILNWLWTPLFFHFHLIGASFIWIVLINLIVIILILKSYQKLKLVSLLLIPYCLWGLFASYLNFYIWLYN